jgi:uncharacterized membrane protein YdjX (TVP38/TMEM64 family)
VFIEIISYIVTVSLATIIPPFTAVPLELTAAIHYGLVPAYIYTITGNVVGSMVAFWVGRRFGWRLVNRLFDEKKVKKAREISQRYTFWQITISRMLLASIWDVLSFVCGLTKMTPKSYFVSSLISTLPSTAVIVLFGDSIDINFAFTVWLSLGIFVMAMYIVLKKFWGVGRK